MERDELMKPRYKVIADYPDSTFEVGEIEDRNWSAYVNGEDDTDGVIWSLESFPHLFRKLEWWEERKPEDMPQYLRYEDKVCTLGDIGKNRLKEFATIFHPTGGACVHLSLLTPATEAEYLAFTTPAPSAD